MNRSHLKPKKPGEYTLEELIAANRETLREYRSIGKTDHIEYIKTLEWMKEHNVDNND